MTLREAVREGRVLGVLAPSSGLRDPGRRGLYRCCNTRESNPFSRQVQEGHATRVEAFEEVRRKQMFLSRASRIHSHPKAALLGMQANQAHVEGRVSDVEVGYLCGMVRAKEEWGKEHCRHSVGQMCSGYSGGDVEASPALWLRFWLEVPMEEVPLGVVSPLSHRSVLALLDDADVKFSEPESSTEISVAALKARLSSELLEQRVIVSGQLRMEERYDGDSHRITQIPVVLLPTDGFRRCVRHMERIVPDK